MYGKLNKQAVFGILIIKIMTLTEKLIGLGLKENEVSVYLATLELGESRVGEIEKKTGLHKQLIYNAAENLQSSGLLSVYEVNGRKRFAIQDPGAIEERAQLKLQEAQAVIPELIELAGSRRASGKLRVWRGQNGVQQYYLETLRKQPSNSTVKILGVTSDRFFKIFPRGSFAYDRMEDLRQQKKISWQVILFSAEAEENVHNEGRRLLEIRVMKQVIHSPIDVMIWNDRIGILIYDDEPYALDIAGALTLY